MTTNDAFNSFMSAQRELFSAVMSASLLNRASKLQLVTDVDITVLPDTQPEPVRNADLPDGYITRMAVSAPSDVILTRREAARIAWLSKIDYLEALVHSLGGAGDARLILTAPDVTLYVKHEPGYAD